MVRWLVIAGVAVVALTVYAVVDLTVVASQRVRAFPKPVWVAVIVVLPLIGPILWLFIGKSRFSAGGRPVAPDDNPQFLGGLEESPDERIKRLEEELRSLDEEDETGSDEDEPGSTPSAGGDSPPDPPRS